MTASVIWARTLGSDRPICARRANRRPENDVGRPLSWSQIRGPRRCHSVRPIGRVVSRRPLYASTQFEPEGLLELAVAESVASPISLARSMFCSDRRTRSERGITLAKRQFRGYIGTLEACRLATPSATPMQRSPAVPAVSSGRRTSLISTPAVGAVSSGSRRHLAKVRVAGSSPVVRSLKVQVTRPFRAPDLRSGWAQSALPGTKRSGTRWGEPPEVAGQRLPG